MANEFRHKDVISGRVLESEYEHIRQHIFNNQATDDMMRASSATQLIRFAVAASRIIGKKSSGNVGALTIQEVLSLLLTAKGDIAGYSTVPIRIPIGTNDHVLTADSAQASGLKWAALVAVAHALGGAQHTADTLSNLNTKISDATLVDTNSIILKALLTTQNDIITRNGSAPIRLNIGASRIVARLAAGNLVAATAAEILTLIGVESGATADQTGLEIVTLLEALASGDRLDHGAGLTGLGDDDHIQYMLNTVANANSMLYSVSDDTPAALAVAASRIVGRKASGNIVALTAAELLAIINVAAGADVTGSNPPQAHKASHQDTGGDEISVTGLSGLLADDQHILDAEAVSAVEAAGLTFAENKGIILDATLSADGKYSGFTEAGTAGTALVFGDLVYLAVADSKWELTDADAEATAFGKIGICVLAANEDAATVILLWGKVRADAVFPALTIGAPVYVGLTPGDIVITAPSATADIVRIIGYGNTADELFFCPDNSYVELA